jgi:hypothetical protein
VDVELAPVALGERAEGRLVAGRRGLDERVLGHGRRGRGGCHASYNVAHPPDSSVDR